MNHGSTPKLSGWVEGGKDEIIEEWIDRES
jgi:hypothetical protein